MAEPLITDRKHCMY